MLQTKSNEDWSTLLSSERIDSARRAVEASYSHLTSDELSYLRQRAKTDLFFLASGVLGYTRLSPNLHGNFCSWVEHTRNQRFRIMLMPRSTFKSTIKTISDNIQCVLPGESNHRFNGPGTRILVAHEIELGASDFIFEITNQFTSNELLMALFPECIPSPREQRMNKLQLELPRDVFYKEPTFQAMGVGARSEGRHYDIITLDDIFGEKARESVTECDAIIDWFDNIQAFFVKLAEGQLDVVGTRWSLEDVYAHMMEMYKGRCVRYIRRMEEYNEKTKSVEIIFPEEVTPESLAILKKNPKVYSAQYTNDPHEGQASFNPAHKRFYERLASPARVAIFTGVTEDDKRRTIFDVADLDRVILCDPATVGLSGIVVTGTDNKPRVYVLDAIKEALKPHEFIDRLFKLVMKWSPRTVAIEEVLFSAVFKPYIEAEMKLRNLRFHITMVKPKRDPSGQLRKDSSKPGRILALDNYFSSAQIYFHETQKDLIWEYDNFGATDNIHLLDALAYGPDVWVPGLSRRRFEAYAAMEEEVLAGHDKITGYSI